MSVVPIKVGETDKTLQGVAYVVAGGLVTGVKTDLVVADIDSLYVIRDQSTAVTISSDGSGLTNKAAQNDPHSDGAVWNPGDGTLFVDCPDAAFSVYAKDVQLKGAWTDGDDSGVIRGTPVALTSGFDWATGASPLVVQVSPISSKITSRVTSSNLHYFVGEIISWDIAIVDSNGDVNMEEYAGSLELNFARFDETAVATVATFEIASNIVTFTNPADVTAQSWKLKWALRHSTTKEVFAHGVARVEFAA